MILKSRETEGLTNLYTWVLGGSRLIFVLVAKLWGKQPKEKSCC